MENPLEMFPELREEKKIVAKALSGLKFESVLEIGSQWGEVLLAIKDAFPLVKLVGIDIDQPVLEEAKRMTGIDMRLGNIFDNNLHSKEFDVVVANALFCMIEPNQVETALEEIIRLAKKYIILVELQTLEPVGIVHGGRTGANWLELFKKHGIKAKSEKISEEIWDANPWKEYGYVVKAEL